MGMNDLAITPVAGHVVIEPQKSERTDSGLYIPSSEQEETLLGTVISVGASVRVDYGFKPSPVSVGDIALFKKYAGQSISLNGKEYKVVNFDDIIAIIERREQTNG
jgi:chaperonin GroES